MAIRLSGLASGMDTETVIKKLLSIEQTKVDREKQKKQILEWKKEDYRDINTKLLALRTAAFDVKLDATFTAKKVTSSDDKTVTATADGKAIPGIYNIKVKQAAQRVSLSSNTVLGSSGDKSTIAKQFGIADSTQIAFTIQGKDGEIAFNFQAKDTSIDQIVSSINKQNIGVNAYYDEGVDRFFLMSNDFGKEAQITVKVDSVGGNASFLKDYLKLGLNYSSPNETAPASGRLITSSEAIATTPPALTATLSSLYEGTETIPATINFTLEGGLGSHAFSYATASTTLQQLLDGINAQQDSTGITASYNAATGEVSLLDSKPLAALAAGSTAANASLTFNEPLYSSSDGTSSGTLTALTDGTDITSRFTYTGSGTLTSATYRWDGTTARVDFVIAGAADTDSISLNGGTDSLFDASGNQYRAQNLSFAAAGSSWTYPTAPSRLLAIRSDAQDFLGGKLHLAMDSHKGTGAIIDFNDATDLEFDSNQFSLNDINFNINSTAVPGTTVNLTVENNVDEAIKKIQAFVDAYNAVAVQLSTKLTESRVIQNHAIKYQPLTDEQKKEMTEDQIEAWEKKARQGLMKNESLLQSTAAKLRSVVSGAIQDKVADSNAVSTSELVDYVDSSGNLINNCRYRSLSAIGINTGGYLKNNTENAKLYIDSDKLREALTTDAEAVQKLFTLTQEDKAGSKTTIINGEIRTVSLYYNIGIGQKLCESLDESISQLTNKAGLSTTYYDNSLMAQEINRADERIDTLVERMEDLEDRYYKRFAAMEQALQKSNQMASWLAQKLGTTNNSSS